MGRKSQHGLPPHMIALPGATGKTYYYFERPTPKGSKRRDRVPLGSDRDVALKAYTSLSRANRSVERAYRGRVLSPLKVLAAVRNRASRAGIDFNLTEADLEELQQRAKGRCEVSGIPFDIRVEHNGYRRAWTPSIDRIDARGSYTLSNCRLVCTAVNVALSDYGEEVFDRIVRGYVRRKYKRRL
jgi:hypothetical protein